MNLSPAGNPLLCRAGRDAENRPARLLTPGPPRILCPEASGYGWAIGGLSWTLGRGCVYSARIPPFLLQLAAPSLHVPGWGAGTCPALECGDIPECPSLAIHIAPPHPPPAAGTG